MVGNVANWKGDNGVPLAWKISSFTLSSDQFYKPEFSVFPNPVENGVINIQSRIVGLKTINVFDVNARAVLSTQLGSDVLDVSFMDRGFYFLNIEINGASTTKKIMIK